MMNKENAFLVHFLEEEIYLINQPASEKKPLAKPIKDSAQIYETPHIEAEKSEADLPRKNLNTKRLLLMVHNISGEEKIFLEKVLAAVKLTIDDCALLQLSENSAVENHELVGKFQWDALIIFGPQDISTLQSIPKYQITDIDNKKVLQADDLKTIMGDVAGKKNLWRCLQQLFL